MERGTLVIAMTQDAFPKANRTSTVFLPRYYVQRPTSDNLRSTAQAHEVSIMNICQNGFGNIISVKCHSLDTCRYHLCAQQPWLIGGGTPTQLLEIESYHSMSLSNQDNLRVPVFKALCRLSIRLTRRLLILIQRFSKILLVRS